MTSDAFLAAGLGLSGASILVSVWTAAIMPSRPAARLGRRGRRRMESLAKSPMWARVEPLVRWLGVRLSAFIPETTARALDRQLVHAGDYLGLLPEEYVALSILSGLFGALFGSAIELVAHAHGLAIFGFATCGLIGPYMDISGAGQERLLRVTRSLPYAVDVLSLCMGAGLDFPGAVRQYAAKAMPGDPLADEMEYVLQMLQLGHTRRVALLDFAERVPTTAVHEFVHTVIHAEEKGHPLADALVIQAQVSRMRRSVRAEEQAAKAGVKLIAPLALIFGSIILLLLGPMLIRIKHEFGGTGLHSMTTPCRDETEQIS